MDPQIESPPGGYYSPHSNPTLQENSWSSGPYLDIQTTGSYWHSSPRGSLRPLEDGPIPISDPAATFNAADATQRYPGSCDTREFTMHPILGMIAHLGHDGTVVRVYGPPLDHHIGLDGPEFSLLSQEDSWAEVPQLPYECGNTQMNWVAKPPIHFFTQDCLGVRLLDARDGMFKGVNDGDKPPFDMVCCGITIRIHFPGYPSSTEVEKKLKHSGGTKARSMQVSTRNYKFPAGPVIKSKLLQEVSKRIEWHIADLRANSDLFPFDDRFGERWRLGQGGMEFDRMVITGLTNVSSSSWSPIIWVA